MSDKSLFQLVKLSHEIQQNLAESFGEITPELEKTLTELNERLPNKADGYKFIIDDLRTQVFLWKKRSQDILSIAKAFEAYSDRLENSIKLACIEMGTEELLGTDYRWKIINSNPSVVIEDEPKIPSKYKEIVQTTKVIKSQILEDLKKGLPIPGAHIEQGIHVRCFTNTKKKW